MVKLENTIVLVIDMQDRLMSAMHNREELEQKASKFIRGCRVLELPILVTQQYTKGLGETIEPLKDALGEFEPIEKITFSCCGNQEFNDILSKSGKKNVIVTGVETHVCVQQTILDLLADNYNVYVVADCSGSRYTKDHNYAEERMRQAGAIVTTMESVLFELLVNADNPKRKEISNLIK